MQGDIVHFILNFSADTYGFLLFILFFSTLFLNYFYLIRGFGRSQEFALDQSLAKDLLTAFLFAVAEINLSQVILSSFKINTPVSFIILNAVISIVLMMLRRMSKHGEVERNWAPPRIKTVLSDSMVRTSLFLVSLTLIYIFLVSFFFHVRGTDDFGYRVPVIFENINRGGFFIPSHSFIPSRSCDPRMAFPQAPYSIPQAYILISGNDTFLDFTNIVFLFGGFLGVWALGSSLILRKSEDLDKMEKSLFISALSLCITPVFIGQLASLYVDLAFASFFVGGFALLVGLSKLSYLLASSIAFGLLVGTKYTGLLFVPLFEVLLIMKIRQIIEGTKYWMKNFLLYFVLSNLLFFAVSSPWYIINFINFGFPLYPEPRSSSGLSIYPSALPFSFENIVKYIHILLAFFKYDNIELSYHKGFGIIFWLLGLLSSLSFLYLFFFAKRFPINRRRTAFVFLLILLPFLYMLWRTIPSIHVNARFFMWFTMLSFAVIPLFIRPKLVFFLFLLQFLTNIPKIMKAEQPLLDIRLVLKTYIKSESIDKRCNFHTLGNIYLWYNMWFRYFSIVSTFVEFIDREYSQYGGSIKISCGTLGKGRFIEGVCSSAFYGRVDDWTISSISSCVSDVREPDIIVLSGVSKEAPQKLSVDGRNYVLSFYYSERSPKHGVVHFSLFLREDLAHLSELWNTCARIFDMIK